MEVRKIKCPCCGAILSIKPVPGIEGKNVKCPVCNSNDIRAEYILKQLKAFQDRIDEWQKKLKEEEIRLAKKVAHKAKVKWLVKIEYHT